MFPERKPTQPQHCQKPRALFATLGIQEQQQPCLSEKICQIHSSSVRGDGTSVAIRECSFVVKVEVATDTKSQLEHQAPAVIVAEKYPIARTALVDLLIYDGYRALQAENHAIAISHIDTVENLAAVLVDLDMSGWQSIIRHAVARKAIPVIAMEGNHYIPKSELEEHGVQVCLRKPIVYHELRQSLTRKPSL